MREHPLYVLVEALPIFTFEETAKEAVTGFETCPRVLQQEGTRIRKAYLRALCELPRHLRKVHIADDDGVLRAEVKSFRTQDILFIRVVLCNLVADLHGFVHRAPAADGYIAHLACLGVFDFLVDHPLVEEVRHIAFAPENGFDALHVAHGERTIFLWNGTCHIDVFILLHELQCLGIHRFSLYVVCFSSSPCQEDSTVRTWGCADDIRILNPVVLFEALHGFGGKRL